MSRHRKFHAEKVGRNPGREADMSWLNRRVLREIAGKRGKHCFSYRSRKPAIARGKIRKLGEVAESEKRKKGKLREKGA